MSYKNFSTGQLSRSAAPAPQISMGWFIQTNYAGTNHTLRSTNSSSGSNTGWGTDNTVGTTVVGSSENSGGALAGPFATGSDPSWIFVCQVNVQGVGVTWYWRHQGETTLHSSSISDTGVNDVSNDIALLNGNSGGGGTPGMYMSAYKEWQNSTDLTSAQILAESFQKAPIVTTNLSSYMSCDVGSIVGTDQSGNGNNWTPSGTITTDTREPNMTAVFSVATTTGSGFDSTGVSASDPGLVGAQLLACLAWDANSDTWSPPAGWTLLDKGGLSLDEQYQYVWSKDTPSTGSGTYSFTASSAIGHDAALVIVAVSGVSGVNAHSLLLQDTSHTDPFSINTTSVTTTSVCVLMWLGTIDTTSGGGAVTYTAPVSPYGFATDLSFTDASVDTSWGVGHAVQTVAEATGACDGSATYSIGGTTAATAGFLVALKLGGPPSSSPSVVPRTPPAMVMGFGF